MDGYILTLMELSVADTNVGFAGWEGLSAARMKVSGEKSPHPYVFLALYLKAYVIPFFALTVAERASVSFCKPKTSVKLPAPSSTCKLYERMTEPPVSTVVVSGLYVTLIF